MKASNSNSVLKFSGD